MADKSWQSALTFSDRLMIITSIAALYRDAHSETSVPHSIAEARTLESRAFEESSNTNDYHDRCKAIQDDLRNPSLVSAKENEELEDLDGTDPEIVIDLGRYKNCAYIQNGLFSTLYKAHSPEDANVIVALKLTIPSTMIAPHDSHREAGILTKLREHKCVITLYESFQLAGDKFVLVLPYVRYDLESLLVQGLITDKVAIETLRHLFKALHYIHSLGIIHRDVKPSNILLKSVSGPAFLSDFGIAWSPDVDSKIHPESSSKKLTDVGTTHYRPPELLFGNTAYGTALDLWAAGCTSAEILNRTQSTKNWSLFDAGDLGSELTLIHSIFISLGTPDETVWPEAKDLPDWGKMQFYEYTPKSWEDLLPHASIRGRDFVSKLVRYQSTERMTAEEVRSISLKWRCATDVISC
jgi:serine/threonine protein kinase